MELRQLEQFVAVAEERSYTRAARRLHVAQSGLSATVQNLERELGTTLLLRTTRRVQVSDAGRELLARSRQLLAAAQETQNAVSAVERGERGTLRLGIMHALVTTRIAHALSAYHQQHPGVDIRPTTHPAGSAGLIRAVHDNELDLAFACPAPGDERLVHAEPLLRETMVLVCGPDHRLAGRKRVALADLADEQFIDVPRGWGSRASAERLLLAHGITRHVGIEVGDVATILDLVKVGFGIALIAPSSAPPLRGLAQVRVTPAPRFEVSAISSRRRPVVPAARGLLQLLRSDR